MLHTRISEHLADDIRRMAEDLRVPVSNLVRNVLEEAFSVVERVTDNVGELIEDVIDEAEAARDRIHRRSRRKGRRREAPPPASPEPAEPSAATGSRERAEFSDVVGWQPVILNRTRSCVDCGTALDVGERSFVGLTQDGLSPHTLCRDCADERF